MATTQLVKYQTDAATIVRIRLSDASITANGAVALGTVDDPNIFAYAQNPGSKRKKQLNARGVRLERFTGTGSARKRFTTFLPCLTITILAAFNIGDTVTLNTVAWTVADKINEA